MAEKLPDCLKWSILMFVKVLSCYKWMGILGTGGVYQRDKGELSEGLERLVRLEHLAVLIKASEMLVAPRISECFGLGLL